MAAFGYKEYDKSPKVGSTPTFLLESRHRWCPELVFLVVILMGYLAATVVESVQALVQPLLDDVCLELVDIQYVREQAGWVVRILIDKEDGVTLDDCTRVSRELGYLLDVKEVIDHPYTLEVSSPGLDRPLKNRNDFGRFLGKRAAIRTTEPLEGRRNFQGTLRAVEGEDVVLDNEGKTWKIPLGAIAKAKLLY